MLSIARSVPHEAPASLQAVRLGVVRPVLPGKDATALPILHVETLEQATKGDEMTPAQKSCEAFITGFREQAYHLIDAAQTPGQVCHRYPEYDLSEVIAYLNGVDDSKYNDPVRLLRALEILEGAS